MKEFPCFDLEQATGENQKTNKELMFSKGRIQECKNCLGLVACLTATPKTTIEWIEGLYTDIQKLKHKNRLIVPGRHK